MTGSRIHVSYDPREPESWTLDRPYERMTSLGPIVVPQGFVTDLASTPRQVWRAFPRWGGWSGAAIVHDWLYRTQPRRHSRYQADRIFLELMRQDLVPHGTRRVLYRMVRQFGDGPWNDMDFTTEVA